MTIKEERIKISEILFSILAISMVLALLTENTKYGMYMVGLAFAYFGLLIRSLVFIDHMDWRKTNKGFMPVNEKIQKIFLHSTYKKNVFLVLFYSVLSVAMITEYFADFKGKLLIIASTNAIIGFHTKWLKITG